MKTIKSIKYLLPAFALLFSLFSLLSCEQPFRAGLGPVVDVRPPTVELESPSPGSYIWGTRTFSGTAEDDYILSKVEVRVTNHPGFTYYYDNDSKSLNVDEWINVSDIEIGRLSRSAQNVGNWDLEIDTRKFPDGDLKIQVMATDSQGKTGLTAEYLFLIRNMPPAITVAAPYIQSVPEIAERDYRDWINFASLGDERQKELKEKYWGTLGAANKLNWNVGGGKEELSASTYKRKLDLGSVISGTISYDEDIYTGGVRTQVTDEGVQKEWYPPQIRIWRVDGPGGFAPGAWPTTEASEAEWKPFAYTGVRETDNLFPLDIGSYQFQWPLPSEIYEAGHFYGFEIRALSKDGRSEFRYPRDYWHWANPGEWDDIPATADPKDADFLKENRYVLFYLKEQSTPPTVVLYNFEDLTTWNGAGYDTLPGDLNNDMAHFYVTQELASKGPVSKYGPFILRLRASHQDGIGSAEVYWENDTKTQRGRFIWDVAEGVTTDNAYSQWGARAPTTSGDQARNFIFTYKHDRRDYVPDSAAYHPLVSGRSKIQVFDGTAEEWEDGKKAGSWPTRTSDDSFRDLTSLDEGVYNLEIYARTPSFTGKVNYTPYALTIRIDWVAPDAEINNIDGVDPDPEVLKLDVGEATVNGVIEPRLSFSDSRLPDSGIRTATGDYYLQSGVMGPEQRWLLIMDGAQNEVNKHIADNPRYWPPMPETAPFELPINGFHIPVVKHGPVSNSRFRFKTSEIYYDGSEIDGNGDTDTLANGDYWLYVFVRDNAFNVGHTKMKIKVDKNSDKPVISFLGDIKGDVTDPNLSAQGTANGFLGAATNNLGPNTNIRLKLRDDDSLDLGMGSEDTSVTIKFSAGQPADADGNVTPFTSEITLTPAEVQSIFAQQGADAGESGANGRTKVRAREGTIRQSLLLEKLRNDAAYDSLFVPKGGATPDKSAFTSLPDGIYRLQIEIADYGWAKLRMDGDPIMGTGPGQKVPAAVKSVTDFWFYVDTTDPSIEITDTGTVNPDGWIEPTGGLIGFVDKHGNTWNTGDGIVFSGTLSDVNGPVKVSNFTISNELDDEPSEWAGKVFVKADEVKITHDAPASVAPAPVIPATPSTPAAPWNAQFQAPVHIDPAINASFKVTLTVQDRFGRTRTVIQRYQLDQIPPEVTVAQRMATFSRLNDDPRLNNVVPYGDPNREILANGVVFFTLSATDNLRVDEVRWWLLPEATTLNADVATAWTEHQTLPLTNGMSGAKLTGKHGEKTYIDTRELTGTTSLTNKGVYNLYAIAKDSAGKFSEGHTTPLQTIYVWQQEDAPYFELTEDDSGVVSKQQMNVSVTITDDDGFFDAAGNIRDGMLKIYLQKDGTAAPGTFTESTGEWSGGLTNYVPTNGWTIPNTLTVAGTEKVIISHQGSKTVKLNLNLGEIPASAGLPANLFDDDPIIHYVIEATDSYVSKFNVDGTAAPSTETKTWRYSNQLYLDSNPPAINVNWAATAPSGATKIFGKTPATFDFAGSISDKYLQTINVNNVDNYYVVITLDGKPMTGTGEYALVSAATPQTSVSFAKTNFFSESTDFTAAYTNLAAGPHTLSFTVYDKSGKYSDASLSFTKDPDAPDFTFTTPGFDAKTRLPNIPTTGNTPWWNAGNTAANWGAKRNATLPIVSYEPGEVPYLEGRFTDSLSAIQASSFKIKFDSGVVGSTTIEIPITDIATTPTTEPGITGSGIDVGWKVYLTKDGTKTGAILDDGVHSIQLSIADVVGNATSDDDFAIMYGFRLVSEIPISTLTTVTVGGTQSPIATARTVYGDREGLAGTLNVFTLGGVATGKNLADAPLRVTIKYMDSASSGGTPIVFEPQIITVPSGTWTYAAVYGTAPSNGTGREVVTETYTWTLAIPRSVILAAGRGVNQTVPKMRAGRYSVTAVAYDRSIPNAKQSAVIEETNVWNFVIDSESPKFSVYMSEAATVSPNNPAVGDNISVTPTYYLTNTATEAQRNLIQDQNAPRITGSVTDDNQLQDVQIQLGKWSYTVNQTTGAVWQIFNHTSNVWADWNAERAVDNAYWGAIPHNPTPPSTDNATTRAVGFDLSNTTRFEDGYYRVRLRARDASTAATASAGWLTTNDGNPAYSQYYFFFLDRALPVVGAPSGPSAAVSTRVDSNVTFTARIHDLNRFDRVEFSVKALHSSPYTVPNLTDKTVISDNWNPSASLRSDRVSPPNPLPDPLPNPFMQREVSVTISFPPADAPDGSYQVSFTAFDLAGKSNTNYCTVTLDNGPPGATISEPRQPITGGSPDGFAITGTTFDPKINSSASEPAGVWYRIGYGNRTALPNLTGLTAQQRSDAIMLWASTNRTETNVEQNNGSGVNITASYNPTTKVVTGGDTGAAHNRDFDAASVTNLTNGSLWYKYAPTGVAQTETYTSGTPATVSRIYDVPRYTVPNNATLYGFDPIPNPSAGLDLYSWSLNVDNTVAANFAIGTDAKFNSVTMRGRKYEKGIDSAAPGRTLARAISDATSTHSLPLVIRVVDNAGNVSYELHDIRLNPNGDNPTSVINTTSARFLPVSDARGGQIQINGVARDNNAVRQVIYRVKADNTRTTNVNGGNAPGDDRIITNSNWTSVEWVSGTGTLNSVWNSYGANGIRSAGISDNNTGLSTTGWYVANLDAPLSGTSSWNFMLNASSELKDKIADWGFKEPYDADENNMIRVWVEVLVFDDFNNAYHLMSLGDTINTGSTPATVPIDNDHPRPYIREFFFTSASATVENKMISGVGTPGTFAAYTTQQAAQNIRGDKFAVKATLDAVNENIDEIYVGLREDSNTLLREQLVYRYGETTTLPAGVTLTWDNTDKKATLTYSFDSKTTTPGYQLVNNGTWATTGGRYTVEVRFNDRGNPSTNDSYTFEIGIDNFAPLADTVTKVTPSRVAGSNVTFLGRVFDYTQAAPVERTDGNFDVQPIDQEYRGLDKVRVWFTERQSDTSYININTGAAGATATANEANVWKNRNYTVNYDKNGEVVESIIVNAAGGPPSAQAYPSGDNYLTTISGGGGWSPNTGDADVAWSFVLDTSKLRPSDGWVRMHYIVYDKAGNASYYNQDIIVANRIPQITGITLYTNNTGEGAVFTTNDGNEAFETYNIPEAGSNATYNVGKFTYKDGYLDSQFIIKNSTVGFYPTTISGNAPLYYKVRYVQRYRIPLTKANLISMAKRSAGTATTTDMLSYYNEDVGSADYSTTTLRTLAVSNFVNLYTIAANTTTLSASQWRILGVPKLLPAEGDHFVFQARDGGGGNDDVNNMDFGSVYVYAYRHSPTASPIYTPTPASPAVHTVNSLGVERTGNNANAIPIVEGQASLLNITGAGNFGAEGRINEARGTADHNAYYPPQANPTQVQRDTASAGKAFFLLTVQDRVWGTDANSLGASGTLTINDESKDRLYDALVIGTKVYVGDTRQPFARLYDLNPYFESEVSGNNFNDTFKALTQANAAAPTAIGENIKRGGLYNAGTETEPVKSGYIDPRVGTTATGTTSSSLVLSPWVNYPADPLNPYTASKQERPNNYVTTDNVGTGTEPTQEQPNPPIPTHNDKVSGKIILRGLAWDDQLIDEIRINIGVATPTAATGTLIAKLRYVYPNGTVWVSTANPPVDPTPAEIQSNNLVRKIVPETGVNAWVYEEIHWQRGHTVEWAYLWDTEAVPTGRTNGGPSAGVSIAVVVVDKLGTPQINAVIARTGANPTGTPANGTNLNGTPAAQPVYHNTIPVDIIPYVTALQRNTLYNTTRSRQGWYSFFQGEQGIAVQGYNLGNGNLTINLNSTGNADADGGDITASGRTFNLGGAAASGRINVYVGTRAAGTQAWNHQSLHAAKSWNREHSAYVNGSDLWTNKLYAHIWRAQDTDRFINSGGVETPAMSLQYTGGNAGRLHGAWANSGEDSVFYAFVGGGGNLGARRLMVKAGEPFSSTDISFVNNSTAANTPAAGNTAADAYSSIIMVRRADGHPLVKLKSQVNEGGDHGGQGDWTTYIVAPHIDPSDTDRWQNTRISKAAVTSADNNAGRVFVTAYDSLYRRLFFSVRDTPMGKANSNSNTDTTGNANGFYLDGTVTTGAGAGGGGNNWTTSIADSGVNGLAAAQYAGEYSAVDYDSNDFPVIAYYDSSNATLRIAYSRIFDATVGGTAVTGGSGSSRPFTLAGHGLEVGDIVYATQVITSTTTTPANTMYYVRWVSATQFKLSTTAGGTNWNPTAGDVYKIMKWTRRNVFATSDALYRGSGTHVSMKIQRAREKLTSAIDNAAADVIHLAFCNSNKNTLVYATATYAQMIAGTAFTAYTVDNVVTGGQYTDISLDSDNRPWIVYADSKRIGTNGGARIAYLDPAYTRTLTDPVYGTTRSIAGWEALSMPASFNVNRDRLNIEVWPPQKPGNVTQGARNVTGDTGNTWAAAVGYGSDFFRLGYFTKPPTNVMTATSTTANPGWSWQQQ